MDEIRGNKVDQYIKTNRIDEMKKANESFKVKNI